MVEFAKGLAAFGFAPHVAYLRDGFRRRELESQGIPLLHLPMTSLVSKQALDACLKLFHFLRHHRIQLVHAFDVPTICFGLPVARLAGVPAVLSSQRGERSLFPRKLQLLQQIAEFFCHGTVVNCQFLARQLLAARLFPSERIFHCPNSIDTAHFSPGPNLRMPELAQASFVFGAVSMYRPEKGLDVLLRAFALLAPTHPGAALLLLGGGPCETDLRALASSLGIAAQCHFVAPVADTLPWLRSVDVFILPTRSEALSNALLEAMAAGLPAVASDVGGNPEIISNGSNGFLFPSGDHQALASILKQLFDDAPLRRQFSTNASESVSERFSARSSLSQMAKIYRSQL